MQRPRAHPVGGASGGPVLLVSPHLDDAVISVGATVAALADAGRRVTVATVFAGIPAPDLSPAAMAFHEHCGLPDEAVQVRRAEDVRAVAEIGADPLHLPFLDAIYRRSRGRWLCDRPGALFAATGPYEPQLWSDVGDRLAGLLDDLDPAVVLTCAAVGGHVDHRLVRSVTRAVCSARRTPLLLWEDLPYGLDSQPGGEPVSLGLALSSAHIERKLRAIAHYPSQLGVLGGGATPWPQRLIHHHRQREARGAAELLWAGGHVQGVGSARGGVDASTASPPRASRQVRA